MLRTMLDVKRLWPCSWPNRRSLRVLKFILLVAACCIALYRAYTIVSTSGTRSPIRTASLSSTQNYSLTSVCLELTCKTDYLNQFLRAGGEQYPIPAIRHIIWINESVSNHFAQQLLTWQKIHPNWTVVLWRDQDLKPFVKRYFPGAFARFQDLEPYRIMQVDMIRYMLLYKFGGVYADLDYTLWSSLDEYRRFYALVTREPEAHSLQFWGFKWPPSLLASPAFMASAPQHTFFRFCIERLQTIPYVKGHALDFAGPFGLTQLLEEYWLKFPVSNFPIETVYIPPSYSFYPYDKNRLNNSNSFYTGTRIRSLNKSCKKKSGLPAVLVQYCKDVNNMDPITDSSQPIVAVHDMQKTGAIYDKVGTRFYMTNLTNMRAILNNLQIGGYLI